MFELFGSLDLFIALRVGVAMLIGALLGFERELHDKPAGLRTHMLMAGAACLFVLLADLSIDAIEVDGNDNAAIRSDPIRVFEAIVVGISFLGAGTIIRHPDSTRVEGLTTAASLLFTGGLGIAVALGRIPLALALALVALLLLGGVRVLVARLWPGRKQDEPDEEADAT